MWCLKHPRDSGERLVVPRLLFSGPQQLQLPQAIGSRSDWRRIEPQHPQKALKRTCSTQAQGPFNHTKGH